MQQPANYQAAWQAVWRYDLLRALAAVRQPIVVAAAQGDAFGHLAVAAAAVLRTGVISLPSETLDLAAVLDDDAGAAPMR